MLKKGIASCCNEDDKAYFYHCYALLLEDRGKLNEVESKNH
ncbi:MAG: hypothetical protein ACP5KW_11650 [Thermoproteota archaeon]